MTPTATERNTPRWRSEDSLAGWVGAICLASLAFFLRRWHLGTPHQFSFDETYYAKDAWSLLNHGYVRAYVEDADKTILNGNVTGLWQDGPSMIVHPEVGKWLIAAGIKVFGMDPTGWRMASAVFGALMVLLCWKMLPESLPVEKRHAFHPGNIARNYIKVLSHPRFLLLALAVGMAFGGLSLYIGSAANFVMEILHLPETAFGWLFIPLISGMVIGSAWGGKRAATVAAVKMKWIGFGMMALACVFNVGYTALFTPAIPWAVLPLMIYTFGLAVAMPAIQVGALALFPDNRGLASSMLAFIQMTAFALVSGVVAPMLFDSAFKLACGVGAGLVASFACWRLSMLMEAAAPVGAGAPDKV